MVYRTIEICRTLPAGEACLLDQHLQFMYDECKSIMSIRLTCSVIWNVLVDRTILWTKHSSKVVIAYLIFALLHRKWYTRESKKWYLPLFSFLFLIVSYNIIKLTFLSLVCSLASSSSYKILLTLRINYCFILGIMVWWNLTMCRWMTSTSIHVTTKIAKFMDGKTLNYRFNINLLYLSNI